MLFTPLEKNSSQKLFTAISHDIRDTLHLRSLPDFQDFLQKFRMDF